MARSKTYYDSGEGRAARVQALFNLIARRYDWINDLQSFGLHRSWKRRLIELARPKAGEQALDVCCGTGDIALGMAERGVHVVGIDFSAAMLKVAEKRTASRGTGAANSASEVPNPRFVAGDAQRLPFPDDSFDIVTVGYGLRNLANWETGLREMKRTAKPGGRLLVLEFGKPRNVLWRVLYLTYLRLFVPLLGLAFCGSASAYSYILESLKHYPAQQEVAEKMQALGLRQVRIFDVLGGAMSIHFAEK